MASDESNMYDDSYDAIRDANNLFNRYRKHVAVIKNNTGSYSICGIKYTMDELINKRVILIYTTIGEQCQK